MSERPTVVLGVTGSIAAYKAAIVARRLLERGVRVVPVMTRAAEEFVGRATFSGLTGEPVLVDAFEPGRGGELHVELGARADAIAVVPATADTIARFASGRAEDLLSATYLCADAPVVIAPAMHPRMWSHPAVARNLELLERDGRVRLVGPVHGVVASGEEGLGRMAEPEDVAAAILAALGPHDLQGLRVVVTAGPTYEDLDPVRYLGNRSTGRMGFAVAERAAARGAHVVLVTGPVSLPTPHGVHRVDVRSAVDMHEALFRVLGPRLADADLLVMSAAVGDYRFAVRHETKLKRGEAPTTLELRANPDVLAEVASMRQGARPVLVGFAVETAEDDELVELARGKLRKKRVDLVVGNHAEESFGKATNRAALVSEREARWTDTMDKRALADAILDAARDLLEAT
jgi:phosphopantothenoylcysteine decarboxylase/phosphopantothenate--cysteine ligase